MGLPFSFADFFGNTGELGPQVADVYRNEFRPSAYLSEPRVNVALQVICAATEAEARFIGASRSLNKIISALGLTTGGLLSPDEAVNWPLDDAKVFDTLEAAIAMAKELVGRDAQISYYHCPPVMMCDVI